MCIIWTRQHGCNAIPMATVTPCTNQLGAPPPLRRAPHAATTPTTRSTPHIPQPTPPCSPTPPQGYRADGYIAGLEVLSERATADVPEEKPYDAIYGLTLWRGDYPRPGTRLPLQLGGFPAVAREPCLEKFGRAASSGKRISGINVCCTPTNNVGALKVYLSDGTHDQLGSTHCSRRDGSSAAPDGYELAALRYRVETDVTSGGRYLSALQVVWAKPPLVLPPGSPDPPSPGPLSPDPPLPPSPPSPPSPPFAPPPPNKNPPVNDTVW